jgi:hypothetical protein
MKVDLWLVIHLPTAIQRWRHNAQSSLEIHPLSGANTQTRTRTRVRYSEGARNPPACPFVVFTEERSSPLELTRWTLAVWDATDWQAGSR